MSKLTKKIVNAETGEELILELTNEEIAEMEAQELNNLAKIAEEENNKAKKAELLERLGLTEDEAKLLLA